MGFLSDALSGASAIYGFDQGIEDVQDVGTEALERAKIEGSALQQSASEFTPFTVTSSLGGINTTPQGGAAFNLTPEQEAIRQQLTQAGTGLIGGTQNLADVYEQAAGEFSVGGTEGRSAQLLGGMKAELGGIGLDPTNRTRESDLINMLASRPDLAREQQIYGELEAMQAPARERERLMMEQRLFGQGRGGVRSAMFGGTPEEFAMSKAQEEARLGSAVQARQLASDEAARRSQQSLAAIQQGQAETGMFSNIGLAGRQQALQQLEAESAARQAASGQALAYQAQQAGLGQSFLEAAYRPGQELQQAIQPSVNLANIIGTGQRQGADIAGQLVQAGLQSKIGAETAASNLRQQQIQAISNLLTGGTQAAGQAAAGGSSGLLDQIINAIF